MVEKHYCHREVELAEMHKDIKAILKALEGNGGPGLVQRMRAMEKSYWRLAGVGATLIALSGLFVHFLG